MYARRETAARDIMADHLLPGIGHRQTLRREGEYWTVDFAGACCRLRDSRGIRHLAYLLRRPHERVSALVLERAAGEREPTDPLPPTGEPDRATRERARINVTRAIAAVLRRVDAHHPDLARHLRATLRTGAYCAYTPDPRVGVEWEAQTP